MIKLNFPSQTEQYAASVTVHSMFYYSANTNWSGETMHCQHETFEVSLFTVDEFVIFDELEEKLAVHTKWLDGWKISLTPTGDYYWQNLHFTCLVLLNTSKCVFSFLLFYYWLFTVTYRSTSCYSTHIPDKFIKFIEFNKLLNRQNLNSPHLHKIKCEVISVIDCFCYSMFTDGFKSWC